MTEEKHQESKENSENYNCCPAPYVVNGVCETCDYDWTKWRIKNE